MTDIRKSREIGKKATDKYKWYMKYSKDQQLKRKLSHTIGRNIIYITVFIKPCLSHIKCGTTKIIKILKIHSKICVLKMIN